MPRQVSLQWSRVKTKIEAAFDDMPGVRVKLYEPKGSPEAKDMPVGTTKPKMTVAPDQYRRIKAELKS